VARGGVRKTGDPENRRAFLLCSTSEELIEVHRFAMPGIYRASESSALQETDEFLSIAQSISAFFSIATGAFSTHSSAPEDTPCDTFYRILSI
jgi:hypothetical protein